ncbi:MAG: aminotransferase class I/II-fold pyridoxal phosphate-dependent enzyme [Pirellulales bacterium]|nr:aminotransferase class I/II-fold pyridoxal phosphate-dependent enzyme [Pirellulales bacterium]
MNESQRSRRQFLKAVGASSLIAGVAGAGASLGAEGNEKLAIDGGRPVRKTLLGYQAYGPQFYNEVERREILEVLDSKKPFRWWKSGSKVLEFEEAYAAHIGVKYAIGVTSGTTALSAALAALEIGPGDEVILPAWTWYADYDTIVLAGALPVFAEVDSSLNIDPADIESRITPRTKAIIAVSLQGCPADMDPILEIARRHKLRVLEDFSQCVGGRYRGKYLGSMADIGISSFQESKTITAGEGGAVVTNDPILFERAVRAHDVGVIRSPYHENLGGGQIPAFAASNYRMNEFTGAILKAQEQDIETICAALRKNARKVREGIADLPGLKMRKTPDLDGDLGVTIFLDHPTQENRDRFLRAMRAEGISASPPGGSVILPIDGRIENKVTVHPDWPSFNTPQGKAIRYGRDCCPQTIDVQERLGGVIMDPNFTEEDLNDIVKAIRKVYLAMYVA